MFIDSDSSTPTWDFLFNLELSLCFCQDIIQIDNIGIFIKEMNNFMSSKSKCSQSPHDLRDDLRMELAAHSLMLNLFLWSQPLKDGDQTIIGQKGLIHLILLIIIYTHKYV